MKTDWVRTLALAAGLVFCAIEARADSVTIDFERFPGADGRLGTADDVMPASGLMLLRDQFSSLGLTFSQGTLGQSAFFNGNPANHFITSTAPIGFLTAGFSGVAIESYSFWDATLTAFDASNAVLGTAHLSNPRSGSSPLRGVLSVNTSAPIHHFSVFAPTSDQILNLDNLVLTTAATVPEPSTFVLLCLGAALAGARRLSFFS